MPSPSYTVAFQAPLSGTSGSGSAMTVLIPDATTGLYVVATTANRAGRRSRGVALSSFSPGGSVEIQEFGRIDASIAGLGAGSGSWVRVSATGTLERASVSGSDDVCGYVETDGTFHACFGFLTASIVNGGGGGGFTAPTGTGFVSVTGGSLDAASIKVDLASATYVTGLLALANQAAPTGTGLVKVSSGAWVSAGATLVDADVNASAAIAGSKVSPNWGSQNATTTGTTQAASFILGASGPTITTGTGVPATSPPNGSIFLRTDGTGTTGIYTRQGAAWSAVGGGGGGTPGGVSGDIQTNNGAGGFGAITPGSGVATMLATFSSANIRTACTDETGSGGSLVFATSPTISGATLTGTSIVSGLRLSGVTSSAATGTQNNFSLGGNRVIEFTNATGPTITGFDATGISNLDILVIINTGGVLAINHEDAGSSAANRYSAGSGASASVASGMVVLLIYYASRWRVLAANAI